MTRRATSAPVAELDIHTFTTFGTTQFARCTSLAFPALLVSAVWIIDFAATVTLNAVVIFPTFGALITDLT